MERNSQRGVTFTGILFFVIVVAILGTYGVQIALGYLDKSSIERIAKTTLTEAKSMDNSTSSEIKSSILKKTSVNNINISSDAIVVQKESDNVYSVDIDYVKEVNITKHVKVVMSYNIIEKTQ